MPIMDESEVSLPKATLSKMIKELIPGDLRFGSESLEMLFDCCTEFVNLVSSESNFVSNREKKNTIHPEHVLKALEDLGFSDFVPEVREAWNTWKAENAKSRTAMRPKGQKTVADAVGLTEEQQIEMQMQLFAEAKARSSSVPDPPPQPTCLEEAPAKLRRLNSGGVDQYHGEDLPSSIYTELAARSDILPILPLPLPEIPSEFSPQVITSSSSAQLAPTEPAGYFRDQNKMASSQSAPIHQGQFNDTNWQALVSEACMLSQLPPETTASDGRMQTSSGNSEAPEVHQTLSQSQPVPEEMSFEYEVNEPTKDNSS